MATNPITGLDYQGDTPASQLLANKGMNAADSILAQFSPTGDTGKINSVDAFTGLINRMIEMALVETWQFKNPYTRYMRELPVDMTNKLVQIIAVRPERGREFDPLDSARILERHYPKSEQRVYGINFDRQYIVSVNDYLLKRGAAAGPVLTVVGQQIANLINMKEVELSEFINDIVCKWVIRNFQRLVNVQFNPADPKNPTQDELVALAQKIDQVSMEMTRFTGTQYALSDVGFTTRYEDLVLDTTALWPAAMTNRVMPWAFHNEQFSAAGSIPNGDGGNSNRVNVLKYLPEGVFGIVRDRNMLTIGQALNTSAPDQTGMPYTRSYNVVHNYAGAVFMDVFKRGFVISTQPDTIPETVTISLASIAAAIVKQDDTAITTYSLSDPTQEWLKLSVTPTGTVTPATAGVHIPAQHKVTITGADADGDPIKVSAKTAVSTQDRVTIDPKTPVGTVLTFEVESLYVDPDEDVTAPAAPLTATCSITVAA